MKIMKTTRTLAVLLMGLILGASFAVAQDHILAEAAKTTEEANASTTGGAGAADKDFHDRYPRYKLSAQPDGYISLRSVGDVMVKGQTAPEVSETIRKAYGNILSNPIVSVVLKDFEKPYFIADGQVGHPGKYDLRGDVTLTEAIAMSGGFLDSAKHSQVLLFRRASKGWYSAETFDVKKMEKKGNLKEDPELHAGDMLFVPKNKFSKLKMFIPGSSMGAFVPLSVP